MDSIMLMGYGSAVYTVPLVNYLSWNSSVPTFLRDHFYPPLLMLPFKHKHAVFCLPLPRHSLTEAEACSTSIYPSNLFCNDFDTISGTFC